MLAYPDPAEPIDPPPAGPILRPAMVVTIVVLAIIVATAGLAQSSAGRRLEQQLGLAAAPEPFTELYFSDPSALGGPATLGRDGLARTEVSFVIHNQQRRQLSYRWQIGFTPTGRLYSGVSSVPRNHRVVVTQSVILPCAAAPGRVSVKVSLQNPRESIGFRELCHG